MSNANFDPGYPAIRLVVRHRRVAPMLCGAAIFAVVACLVPTILGAVAGLIAAACVWGFAKLGVEIVEVLADTLLPR